MDESTGRQVLRLAWGFTGDVLTADLRDNTGRLPTDRHFGYDTRNCLARAELRDNQAWGASWAGTGYMAGTCQDNDLGSRESHRKTFWLALRFHPWWSDRCS